jgi:hypothetical protein
MYIYDYLAEFLLERQMFLTQVVEKIRTHILCPIIFFREIMPFMREVEINMVGPDGPQVTI